VAEGTAVTTLSRPFALKARANDAVVRDQVVVGCAYLLLVALTVPFFMGDTVGYADAILERRFTDFGHFGWYLLGYVASEALMPLTRLVVGQSEQLNITFTLVTINVATGLLSVLLMYALVYRLTRVRVAAYLATAAMMLSQSFLDFTQSGCSYTAGMACLLLALWLLARDDQPAAPARTAAAAGAALFAAVALWFTYVFAVPGVLLAPAVLYGMNARRLKLGVLTAIVLAVLVLVTFGIGAYALGIRSPDGVKAWIIAASHGVRGMQGIPRMIFGLARSFIDTGNDGPLVKAYLAGDAYNPVSLADLVRTSLWKVGLIYGFLGAMLLALLRARDGRRALTLLAMTAVPVLAFAVLWQGNAVERYLPMFPALFVALGVALAIRPARTTALYVGAAFVTLLATVNLTIMAKPVQDARERAASDRIRELEPLLQHGSVVATVTQMDEVWAFGWTFPFDPLNASGRLRVYHLIEPGTNQALRWRELFASTALRAWNNDADVWVSRRVLAYRPLRSWKWVEGDDAVVSWKDVPDYFRTFEVDRMVGGEDGFLRLAPTSSNKARLTEIATGARPAGTLERGPEGPNNQPTAIRAIPPLLQIRGQPAFGHDAPAP
jgi:hypothetical protein